MGVSQITGPHDDPKWGIAPHENVQELPPDRKPWPGPKPLKASLLRGRGARAVYATQAGTCLALHAFGSRKTSIRHSRRETENEEVRYAAFAHLCSRRGFGPGARQARRSREACPSRQGGHQDRPPE